MRIWKSSWAHSWQQWWRAEIKSVPSCLEGSSQLSKNQQRRQVLEVGSNQLRALQTGVSCPSHPTPPLRPCAILNTSEHLRSCPAFTWNLQGIFFLHKEFCFLQYIYFYWQLWWCRADSYVRRVSVTWLITFITQDPLSLHSHWVFGIFVCYLCISLTAVNMVFILMWNCWCIAW